MLKLVLKRIARVGLGSWGVGLAAMLVASFALGVTQIMQGSQASLQQAIDRLGADLVVVPEGVTPQVQSALLIGLSDQAWMPSETLARVASAQGVRLASPQSYLVPLEGLACCPGQEILLVAYDPASDFTIQPWLQTELPEGLQLGEAAAGSQIAARLDATSPSESMIEIGDQPIRLAAALEPTGTRLDRALFVSYETAAGLALPGLAGELSAVMVKVNPGEDPYAVAVTLMHEVPGINPITSLDLFQAYRRQLTGLLRSVGLVIAVTLTISILLAGLIFSMAANERRRELGVLRALGATRMAIFSSLVLEAALLAGGGGLAGILLTGLASAAFQRLIVEKLELPFLPPSPQSLVGQVGLGLVAALLIVTAAVILPAFRISREEPAYTMRE